MNYPLAAAITSFTGDSHLDRRVLRQHFGLDSTIFPIDGPEFARRTQGEFHAQLKHLNTAVKHNRPQNPWACQRFLPPSAVSHQ
jgi:hypothetical protein